MKNLKLYLLILTSTCFQVELSALDYVSGTQMRHLIQEQPYLIEFCIGDRYYVNEEKIRVSKYGIMAVSYGNPVRMPSFYKDDMGYFMLCKKKEVPKEAQEHYDNAGKKVCEALGHSVGAAGSLAFPPGVVKELAEGTQAWIDAAKEYNSGKECERKAEEKRQEEKRKKKEEKNKGKKP